MTDLIDRQKQLQQQAFEIVERLDLINILGKHGQVSLEGSAKYGLMTWRDIDINLVSETEPSVRVYWDIVKTFFSFAKVKTLTLADNRQQVENDRPKSMYIGVKYEDNENNIWKIDIRFLARKSITPDRIEQLIKDKMTEASRLSILHIKSQIWEHPKYHKVFSSKDIYEGVLLAGIKNLDDFKAYLSQKGISI